MPHSDIEAKAGALYNGRTVRLEKVYLFVAAYSILLRCPLQIS